MVGIPYFYTSIFEELPSADFFFYILKFESAIRDKEFEVGTRYALLHKCTPRKIIGMPAGIEFGVQWRVAIT